MALTSSSPDWSRRVMAVANELRLVQADLADRDEEQRRPYLQEVLKRALAPIASAEDRQAFLIELSSRFPTWDGRSEESLIPQRAATAPAPTIDDKNPEALIARLAELAKQSPEAASAIQAGLRSARLVAEPRGSMSRDAEMPLRAVLQVEDQQPIDPARAMEVLAQLLDYFFDWDRVVWNTWRQLAPESHIRRPQPLQRSIKGYFTGEPGAPRGQLMRDIGVLKQLMSSLVSAVGIAGSTFAAEYLKEISPQQIEDFVRGGEEKLPYIGDRFKTGCWNKYVQLAAALEDRAPAVINMAVVGFVEQFVRGAMVSPAGRAGSAASQQQSSTSDREEQGGAGSNAD